MQSGPVVRFGVFELDLHAGELRKHGLKIKLQDQPLQILIMLLERPGQVVTREQLHQKLWAEGTFVDFEHGLNAAVQRLRQALGDSADNPRFVQTLARHGYRFLASVDGVANQASAAIQPAHEIHEMKASAQGVLEGREPIVEGAKRRNREALAWALLAVVSLACVVLAALYFRKQPTEAHIVRYQVPLPDEVRLESFDIPAISPNGQQLVFAGVAPDGKRRLWFRSLDSVSTYSLPGSEDARMPFWSPDSRFVAFFAASKIKKIDVTGGPPVTLSDVHDVNCGFMGGSWSPSGVILISSGAPGYSNLHSVSAAGGVLKSVLQFDKPRHEKFQWFPHFLPDGRHFVYFSVAVEAGSGSICLGSLDSPQTRKLISAESNMTYAPPGFLIYGRQETLLAQPFDVKTLQLKGEVITVAEQVARAPDNAVSLFSTSDKGVLVYGGPSWPKYQLTWHGRDGAREGSIGEPGRFYGLSLSPDEKRLALHRPTPPLGNDDIWTLELASGIFSRVTTHPDDDGLPIWSPDGRELLFSSVRTGRVQLYRKVLGGGDEERLLNSDKIEFKHQYADQWLKDGSILFSASDELNPHAFYLLPRGEESKPLRLLKPEFEEHSARVSSDGRWVAYQSLESGRWEIYLAAFPRFTEKRQVSKDGGTEPRWRNDAKELFYLSLDGKLMSVDVQIRTGLENGAPRVLFQTSRRVQATGPDYCVTGDGKRFIFGEPVEEDRKPLTVVQNWTAGLKR
jgi:DNA-binding winged helix-turn-helix (wHTH) protein/Tol biopolymer transport system component